MQPTAVLKTPKGFTLIEVLSVVVIIGILAAIAVPSYNTYVEKSRGKAAEAAIAEVKSRLSLEYSAYLLENKNAPANMGAFLGATARNNTTTIGVYATDIGTGFSVALTNNSTTATIEVSAVKGVALDTDKTDTWELP